MYGLKDIKCVWILVLFLIFIVDTIIMWWLIHQKGYTLNEIVVSDLFQHNTFLKLQGETFSKVECNNTDQEYGDNVVFAVIPGFSIPKELILSAEKNLHFIIVGQHNEETIKMDDDSTFHFVFCRDYFDTNSTSMLNRLSTHFRTSVIENNLKAVIFLDIKSQHTMWPVLSQLLQGNLIARKNIGYLLAIALGAEYIVDLEASQLITHPESLSVEKLTEFKSKSKHPVIASLHSNVNNPYVLMGPRTNLDNYLNSENALKNIWPRGYPKSELAHKEVPTLHSLAELQTRLNETGSVGDCIQFTNDIIQILVDETPDVYLEYQKDSPPLPVTFLPESSRLSIHPSQFAPFNAHSTIFSRHAFGHYFYRDQSVRW